MNAQDILVREHELIRTYLDTLELALCRLELGESVPRVFFDYVVAFARGFVDEHHHFKEELLMFELLVRKKGAVADSVSQLQHEHERGRLLVTELESRLGEYEAGQSGPVLESATAFVSLLRHHIDVEDHVCFPLARRSFTPQEQSQLLEDFRSLAARDARSLARHQAMVVAMGELLVVKSVTP